MKRFTQSAFALACIAFTPAAALAHPGSDHWAHHHFTAGFLHPFTGIDHILAMVAVGMWAAQLGGRARWQVPLAFIALMAAGGFLAQSHVSLPFVETAILASVLITGLLLLFALRLPTSFAVLLAGAFAIFHGYAHVIEMPFGASLFAYSAGFIIATAILLMLGTLIGHKLTHIHHTHALRTCGGAVAVATLIIALA